MAKIRGWKFPVDIDETTGKIMTVDDNENIKQSVKIILQTEKSERKMRSNFGTRLNRFMFQNVDLSLVTRMSDEIDRSIRLWEGHIKQLSVTVRQSPENISAVLAEVSYITDLSPQQETITKEFSIDNLDN